MPSVVLVSTVPAFVSSQEHAILAGSTPASFDDIPPVLCHKEENVSIVLEPPFEGFAEAHGTLFVLESLLVFMSTVGQGFEIKYPSITLHAIWRAQSGPCIYCQLDESNGEGIGEDNVRELSIIPNNEASLEPIFEALSHCAALHPDDLQDSDGNEDDAFIDAGAAISEPDESEEVSEVGRATVDYLESIIEDPKGLLEGHGQI